MEYRKIKILSLTLLLTLIFTGCFGGGKSSNINESQNITSTENPEMVKIRNAALKREEILIKIQEKVKSEKQNSIQQNKSPLNPDTVNDDIYFALSTDSVEIYATNSTMIYRFVYIENAMSVFPEKYTGTMTMYFTIVNGEWILTDGNVDFAEITLSSAKGVVKNLITQEEISDAIVYGIAGDEITRTVKTDTQGVFIIPDIIDNNYDIYVKKAGYTTIKLEDISFDVQKEKQLGIILMSPDQNAHFASISGSAYWDTEQTDPAEGATIYITNSDNTQTDIIPAKTDSTGYYEISYIPAGTYKINAKYINNRSISANLTISNSQASNKNNINMTPLILAGNNKPQITETYPQTTDINLEIGTEQIFAIKVTDLDSDEIVYNWSCSNGSLQLTTTSVNSWEATRSGQQWVKVTASDRKGGEVEQTFNINVINTVGIIEYDIVKRETFFADSQNNVMHTDIDGISYDIIVPENTFSGTLSLKATRFDQNIPLDPWFNNSGIEQKGKLGIEIASTSDLNSPIIVKVPASDLNINTTNTIITMRNSGNSEEYYLGFEEKDGYLEIYVMPEFMENIETATPNRAEIMDPNDISDLYEKIWKRNENLFYYTNKLKRSIELSMNENNKIISVEDSGFSGGTGYLSSLFGNKIPDLNQIAGDTPVEGEDNILVVHGIFCWTEIMGGDYYRIHNNTVKLNIDQYNNWLFDGSFYSSFLPSIHQWNSGLPSTAKCNGSLIEWLRHKDNYTLYKDVLKKDASGSIQSGVYAKGNGIKNFNVMKYNYNSLANNHETGANLAEQITSKLSGNNATLTIVCHSMGGLVTRRALAELCEDPEKKDTILPRIKKVVFLSTPNRGGKFTNIKQETEDGTIDRDNIDGPDKNKIPHNYIQNDEGFNPIYPHYPGWIARFSQAINFYFQNIIKPNLAILASAARNPELVGIGLSGNIKKLPTGLTQLMGIQANEFLGYISNYRNKIPVSYFAIIDNDDLLVDIESIDLTGRSGNSNEYFYESCETFKNYFEFKVNSDKFLEFRKDLPWLHFSTTIISDEQFDDNKIEQYLKELIPNKNPEIIIFSYDDKLFKGIKIEEINGINGEYIIENKGFYNFAYKIRDIDSNNCNVKFFYKLDNQDTCEAEFVSGDIGNIDTSIFNLNYSKIKIFEDNDGDDVDDVSYIGDYGLSYVKNKFITWNYYEDLKNKLNIEKSIHMVDVTLQVEDEIDGITKKTIQIICTSPSKIEKYCIENNEISEIHKGVEFEIIGKNFKNSSNVETQILYKSSVNDYKFIDKSFIKSISDTKIVLSLPEDAVSGLFELKVCTKNPNSEIFQYGYGKELSILGNPVIYIEPFKENSLELSYNELYEGVETNETILLTGFNLGNPLEKPELQIVKFSDSNEIVLSKILPCEDYGQFQNRELFGYKTKLFNRYNPPVFPLYIRIKAGSQYSNIFKYPCNPPSTDIYVKEIYSYNSYNGKICPNSGEVGKEVFISGNNFGNIKGNISICDNEIEINHILSWSNNEISFILPNGLKTGVLKIKPEYSNNYEEILDEFIVGPEFIEISSTHPYYHAGQHFTVEGNNFEECDLMVKINDKEYIWTNGKRGFYFIINEAKDFMIITLPEDLPLGEYQAYFVNKNSGLSWQEEFKVFPEINKIYTQKTEQYPEYGNDIKYYGIIRETLNIEGLNFNTLDTVRDKVIINYFNLSTNSTDTREINITSFDNDIIQCVLPDGTVTGNIYLRIDNKFSNDFELYMAPNITSISNTVGAAGDIVEIYGWNFSDTGKLHIDNRTFESESTITSWSNYHIKFVIPDNVGAGIKNIVIEDKYGIKSNIYSKLKVYPVIDNVISLDHPEYNNAILDDLNKEFKITGSNFSGGILNKIIEVGNLSGDDVYDLEMISWYPTEITGRFLQTPMRVYPLELRIQVDEFSSNIITCSSYPYIVSTAKTDSMIGLLHNVMEYRYDDNINIYGYHFTQDCQIYLGDTQITDFSYVDQTYDLTDDPDTLPDHSVHSKFSFNIPENIDPGTQEIKITNNFGGYDTTEIFIVPTIDGFYYSNENELSVEGGKYSYNFSDGSDKILIISGSNFGDIPHEVRLIQSNGNDYNTMNIISWEFDRITCQIPDNFTNGYIEIVYNSGEFEEEVDMDLDKEINFYPVITSIYNSSNNNFGNYSYNDRAEISGINLVGGIRKLYIDNNEYPYNSWYNNKVTLNIPNLSAGNHNIRLEIDGRNTNTLNFNFMGE